MDRQTLLDLIPAYAIDAVDDDERQAIEALLATDTEARQLLDEYQAVADVFALAVPERQAPPSLRSGLEKRLADRRANDATAPLQPQDKTAQNDNAKVTPLPRLWIGIGAAAAVFLVLVISFVAFQQLNNDDEQRSPNEVLYRALVDTEGSKQLPITAVMEGVDGDMVISPDGKEVMLRLADLPTVDETQSYQLWAQDDEDLHSVAIYHWATGHGPYFLKLNLAKPIDAYSRFGMSVEPYDGSPYANAPSGDQIWGLSMGYGEEQEED